MSTSTSPDEYHLSCPSFVALRMLLDATDLAQVQPQALALATALHAVVDAHCEAGTITRAALLVAIHAFITQEERRLLTGAAIAHTAHAGETEDPPTP